jgi:hypothetical protein
MLRLLAIPRAFEGLEDFSREVELLSVQYQVISDTEIIDQISDWP